jgi:hypothetical protein
VRSEQAEPVDTASVPDGLQRRESAP